jgi:N6-adenosine-specific RNA methylase IME4
MAPRLIEPYRAVIADCPWRFKDRGSRAAPDYKTMSTEALCALGEHIRVIAAPDAYLLHWIVSAMIDDGLAVCRAWGFEPKATVAWIKITSDGLPRLGMGHHVRNAHEIAILATRGRPERSSCSVPSWFADMRFDHSSKPDEQYELVEDLSPGPYLELFSRRIRRGWTVIGDEIEGGIHDGRDPDPTPLAPRVAAPCDELDRRALG